MVMIFYRQYRMNYYAVKALMARAYMWKEDYSKAKECAIEVIEEVADEKNPLFPLCVQQLMQIQPPMIICLRQRYCSLCTIVFVQIIFIRPILPLI